MDLTGCHLGKYKLLERVGQGGMAYVYRAHQPTIDRPVAVKVLHSHLAEDAQFLERFKREAKGLGTLRHPHIVSVIDFDVDDGRYYMVMDFIEGETLQAVLARRGRLRVDEALRLTAQLADALDYAHRHGRIHRDVKPGNVIFADAAGQHAVITDFGLARLLDSATITVTGAVAGTPAYMSPEAAQGEKVDARSDIYSLGMILYEMVTGQRAYRGETPLSVIRKVVLEQPPPAGSLNPDLPAVVDDILNRTIARRPEERYHSAAEMLQAVLQAMESLGLRSVASEGAGNGQAAGTEPEGGPASTPGQAENAANVFAKGPEAGRVPSRRPPLPLAAGVLSLLAVLIVVGLVVLNDIGDKAGGAAAAVPGAVPGLTATEDAPNTAGVAEMARPAPAGALRFTQPDNGSLRQYTLSLDDVPEPPAGSHYELWFDLSDRLAPENVAEVRAQNGRITYADALVDSLAAAVTGARISLEPDFDDDPTLSVDVVFAGTVEADSGLAEIEMFATGEHPQPVTGGK